MFFGNLGSGYPLFFFPLCSSLCLLVGIASAEEFTPR